MAYKIPGVTQGIAEGVVELWDAILHGMVRVSDPTKITLEDGTGGVVKFIEKEVTCAQGVATETAICTIPANSLILDVMTYCSEAFNGAVTKTFQVGLTGNKDKYIDDVDCPVTLAGVMSMMTGTNQDQKTAEPCDVAMAIVSTHTNTTGATAGKIKVKVVYV